MSESLIIPNNVNPLMSPRNRPTEVTRAEMERALAEGSNAFHESWVRSYHVLSLVRDLLIKKVDHEVILQIIDLNYQD